MSPKNPKMSNVKTFKLPPPFYNGFFVFRLNLGLTLSYMRGGRIPNPPLMFYSHHPETAESMKLKLSDFKDTCLKHILQVIPGLYILRCHHGNKITKGTLQNLTQ